MRRRPLRILQGLALALALLGGGCDAVRPRSVSIAELQRDDAWTGSDAAARRLLDQEGLAGWSTRRTPIAERAVIEVGADDDPYVLPSPSAALSTLLGFAYEPRYRYAPEQGCFVLLFPGRPPVIVPERQGGPRPSTSPDAPPMAWRIVAAQLDADIDRLQPKPPTSPAIAP